MRDPKYIRNKFILFFGKEIGIKKFQEALILSAKNKIKIEQAAIQLSEGKLKNLSDLKDKKEPRSRKSSVYTTPIGLPSLGKKK